MSGSPDHPGFASEPALQSIDLLLGEGSPEQLAALRGQLDADPLAMLAMAETVALVETLRELRTEPSTAFAAKLAEVVHRAARRLPTPEPVRWRGPLLMAAAAFVAYVGLQHFDPLGRRRPAVVEWICAERKQVVEVGSPSVVPEAATVAWESTIDRMRLRLGDAGTSQLRDALEAGLRPARDELSRWVDPRNALVWLRLDHELRANATQRWELMARNGGLPAADERAQQVASGLAAQLPALLVASPSPSTVVAVALAMRALIATGAEAGRNEALAAGGRWLAMQAERCGGATQVCALTALIEHAAVFDANHDVVRRIGDRLVDDVLRCDAETWERRLPQLVGSHIEVAVLGDVGRLLARLPGFGVDAVRCGIVRQLCLGQLRTRCAAGQPTAGLLAALVFGFADLLPEPERAGFELQLQRWKPVRLLPDYVTVQQLAWGIEPGRRGFTSLQGELRQLAVCPTPAAFADRAAFCLCLAKDYAAFTGHGPVASSSDS